MMPRPPTSDTTATKYADRPSKQVINKRNRTRLAKTTKLDISTPGTNRTLKPSARRELSRKKAPFDHISPWVQDEFYQLKPHNYPPASLLGLPVELRQKILLLTGDSVDMKHCAWEDLIGWAGNLSCLSPLLRIDMTYVRQLWHKEKVALESPQPTGETAWGPEQVQQLGVGRSLRMMRGSQMNAKSKRRGKRDQKCWRCQERHISKSPKCPLATENPSLCGCKRRNLLPRNVLLRRNLPVPFFMESRPSSKVRISGRDTPGDELDCASIETAMHPGLTNGICRLNTQSLLFTMSLTVVLVARQLFCHEYTFHA